MLKMKFLRYHCCYCYYSYCNQLCVNFITIIFSIDKNLALIATVATYCKRGYSLFVILYTWPSGKVFVFAFCI